MGRPVKYVENLDILPVFTCIATVIIPGSSYKDNKKINHKRQKEMIGTFNGY